jgi:hypothetical protein
MLYTPGAGRAWTPRFNEYFEKRFGYDPVPLYPAMFMDIGADTASARNTLFGFRATLFSESFVKTITDWLKPYNIPLTGHVDQEEVVNPTGMSGDAIKFFEYQPIPGLDQVFQYGRGSCMYKLISSAAINYDRHLVLTEVYGGIPNMPVANLYKEAMDQAAKGVNMFVPHAVWYNSNPRAVVFQPELSHRTQPYAAELPKYNEYIGRLHTLLQQPGTTVADIAILYPIESLQATYYFGGPLNPYIGGVPSDADNYMRLGEYLSFALRRDFFYLHPETLLKRCSVIPSNANTPTLLRLNNKDNPVEFRTLILPSMEVIGLETLRRVHEFQQAGGNVIVVGRLPRKSAEQGKDAEVLALLEKIFGKEALAKDLQYRQPQQFRVEASSEWAAGSYAPQLAFDENPDTRWNSVDGSANGQWLKVVLPEPVEMAKVVLVEPFDRVAKFQIQTFDTEKNDWTTLVDGGKINRQLTLEFPVVKTKELRILFDHPGEDSISISEVHVCNAAGDSVLPRIVPSATSVGTTSVIHDDPVLSISRCDGLLRESLKGCDVWFVNEKALPVGTPTGSFMVLHRIIAGRDVYFFSNSTSAAIETTVMLRDVGQRRFEWWNPHDGSIQAVPAAGTAIPLKLGPVESRFLVQIKEP